MARGWDRHILSIAAETAHPVSPEPPLPNEEELRLVETLHRVADHLVAAQRTRLIYRSIHFLKCSAH